MEAAVDIAPSPFLQSRLGLSASGVLPGVTKQNGKPRRARRAKRPPASPMRTLPHVPGATPKAVSGSASLPDRLLLPKVNPETAMLEQRAKIRKVLFPERHSPELDELRIKQLGRINSIIDGRVALKNTNLSNMRSRLGGGVGSWIVRQCGQVTSTMDVLRYTPLRRRRGSAAFEVFESSKIAAAGRTATSSRRTSFSRATNISSRPSTGSRATAVRNKGRRMSHATGGASTVASALSDHDSDCDSSNSGSSDSFDIAQDSEFASAVKVPKRLMRSVSERLREAHAQPDRDLPVRRRKKRRRKKHRKGNVVNVAPAPPDNLLSTPTHFGVYSMAEVLQLKTMFDMFDVDNSRFISLDEFVNNSEWEDMFHMKDNAFSMFHKMDKNGDGKVTFMELMAVTFPLASMQQLKAMCKMVNRVHTMQRKAGDQGGLTTVQVVRLEKRFKRVATSASGTVVVEKIVEILSDPSNGLPKLVGTGAIHALRELPHQNMTLDEFLSLVEGIALRLTEEALNGTL